MANKVRAAHDALATLLGATFPGVMILRNPGGHVAPKPRVAGALEPYVALSDDTDADVVSVLMGPIYDLKARPCITLAFAGGAKDARSTAAYDALASLAAALAQDHSLGGSTDYADIDASSECDAEGATAWLAGGLEIHVGLLIGGCATRAG